MAYLYKEIKHNGVRSVIQRLSDTAFIPLDQDNSDYQEFLRLVSEQGEENILEPAS